MFFRKDKNDRRRLPAKPAIIVRVLFFLLLASSISAKTLEKYKENIQHLQRDFASLISEDVDTEFFKKVFEEIPVLLPAEEEIEFGETSLEVNNKWLGIAITKYKDKTSEKEKQQILIGISERLIALEIKINEFQQTAKADGSKDEAKRKLAEILKREEFQKPIKEEESLLQRFFKWLDEWMKKNAGSQRPNDMPASNLGSVARVMQFVLSALVIALIFFLLYKFGPFLVQKFREREKRNKNERIILGEKISADETSANLFSEAEELAQKGNLRDAIRKGYIAFLFELSERKLIGLANHKTNRDYLRAVRPKSELYKNMNGLTLNYERHWYGFEDAEEQDWKEFCEDYNDALNKE